MEGVKVFVIFLIFRHISVVRTHDNVTEVIECLPGQDYREECNRCWCVKDGILVCDKIDCKSIPRKMWAKIKLKTLNKKEKSGLLLALAEMVVPVIAKAGKDHVEKKYGIDLTSKTLTEYILKNGKKVAVKVAPDVIRSVVSVATGVVNANKGAAKDVHKTAEKIWNKVKNAFKRWVA